MLPVEVTANYIAFDDQELNCAIIRDITDRRRAEAATRSAHEELERNVAERTAQLQAANAELESFAYSVSHDLRAPLRAIDGFSQALLEDYEDQLDDIGKSYLNRVRAASQNMGQLIDDLLNLSRLTRQEMVFEDVNLSTLAHDIIAQLREAEPERSVQVEIEENIVAYADRRLLYVALVNLIHNAWKFTSKRESALIKFSKLPTIKGIQDTYYVADNGAGFDTQYINKLFNAFQRLHTQEEFSGTGIGLATVKRIVDRHGGHVWAEAQIDGGATFYFTLSQVTKNQDTKNHETRKN
jgi:light-regulated signal transduction histidine kinase (bacteriophytochrome)